MFWKIALAGIEPRFQGLITKSSLHCATKTHAVMWSEVIFHIEFTLNTQHCYISKITSSPIHGDHPEQDLHRCLQH